MAEHRTMRGVIVPDEALEWRFMRSSAPGGQHVNTSDTQVELRCDLTQLRGSDVVLQQVRERLGDEVRVRASDQRSQLRNRETALERLLERIDAAARRETPRRPTKPSRSAVRRRLQDKQERSDRKSARRWRPDD